ncbi:MAG TPA: DUF4336 domain-containing protein [Candidatus Binataceae bacterium]|nr:DUF4336 domain-containing protein [Candidatus Binataceae bacterium]
MLNEIAPEIWIADGPSVRFFGFPYPTRMTIVRLADRSLWVCSPIALSPPLAEAINALGHVRHLVSPNKVHHLFLGQWALAWPDAKLYSSPGLTRRRRDLTFANELGDAPDPAWAKDIDQVIFHGSFAMEEVVFFHRASRSVIVTDLVQKFDPATLHGWRGALMRLDGLVGPDGSTPREWRLSFWNRRAARAALRKALAWNPQRLIIAHGEWVRENGCESLAHSLRWLADDQDRERQAAPPG